MAKQLTMYEIGDNQLQITARDGKVEVKTLYADRWSALTKEEAEDAIAALRLAIDSDLPYSSRTIKFM